MTKYILHGGYTRVDNELNRSFFREILRDVPKGGKILIVLFAVDNPATNRDELFNSLVQKFTEQTRNKNILFTQATEVDFEHQLLEASAVYIHGGNTPTLLTVLKSYENLKDKFEDKTIVGSSAGAYALATYGTAHTEEHMRKGLGILPIRLVCHFESPELPPTEASLEELQAVDLELELVTLRDCEWRVFEPIENIELMAVAVERTETPRSKYISHNQAWE
jgi:peptidase E